MLCTARHPGMITSEMMCTFSFFLILSLIEAYGKTVRPAAQKPYSLSVFATVTHQIRYYKQYIMVCDSQPISSDTRDCRPFLTHIYCYQHKQRRLAVHTAAALNSNKQFSVCYKLTLTLFMFRVLTDDSDASLSLDDFAFFANRFYR